MLVINKRARLLVRQGAQPMGVGCGTGAAAADTVRWHALRLARHHHIYVCILSLFLSQTLSFSRGVFEHPLNFSVSRSFEAMRSIRSMSLSPLRFSLSPPLSLSLSLARALSRSLSLARARALSLPLSLFLFLSALPTVHTASSLAQVN